MRDYINIGSSPSGEDCAQVGTDNYLERDKKECTALIHQLYRELGEAPDVTYLSIKSFPHDFGTYHEVICYYDDEDEDSTLYAFKCEANLPELWDEEAKKELGI